MGLVGAPPPSPAGSLLSLGFLPALHTWEFSLLLLRDSQADLHSQDSNPGSSSIQGLLPLVNPSWEYRNLKLRGVAASSRSLAYLREPLPPPPPAFLDWGPWSSRQGGNSHPCSSAHRLLRLLPSRCCLGFNFCVAVRKLPVITASARKHPRAQTLLPAVARLPRRAGVGLQEPPSGSRPLPTPATLMRKEVGGAASISSGEE